MFFNAFNKFSVLYIIMHWVVKCFFYAFNKSLSYNFAILLKALKNTISHWDFVKNIKKTLNLIETKPEELDFNWNQCDLSSVIKKVQWTPPSQMLGLCIHTDWCLPSHVFQQYLLHIHPPTPSTLSANQEDTFRSRPNIVDQSLHRIRTHVTACVEYRNSLLQF